MGVDVLKVNMLGGFSMEWHGNSVDDEDNRSRKAWLLLAYTIYHRTRRVAQDELLRILWEDDSKSSNPQGAMKTLLHRARTMLAPLGDNAGYQILLFKDGCYSVNPELAISCDIEEFERLCKAAAGEKSEGKQLELYMRALELYKGDFLPKLTMEHWTVPIEAYYHGLFLQAALEASGALEKQQRHNEAAALCRSVLAVEPYSEPIYLRLLKSLLASGDREGAISAYEKLSKQLYDNFGTLPTPEATAVYREASTSINEHAILSGALREQLREEQPKKGALVCDYDMLKTLYQAQARQIARSGDVYHVAMFTVRSWDGAELSRRSLDVAMDNFQELLRLNLRAGDVIAKCSSTQFVVILPQANYECSNTVCARMSKLFARQYPHSPAKTDYVVQPLEPNAL